jgi:hypothetical protein
MSITTNLMELDTIGRCLIFFCPVESDMRQIVPDREYGSGDQVGEEELVEHEEDAEWDDRITMGEYISIHGRWTDDLLIVETISEPDEYRPHLEYIDLLDHIYEHCCP